MKIAKVLFLFFVTVLFHGINPIKCLNKKSNEQDNIHTSFLETRTTNGNKILPGIFDIFSIKKSEINPIINFNLEENTNFGLRQTLHNELKRNMRRNFADFQELRQNDILRFQDLLVVQNEQLTIIKDILMSLQ